MPSRHVQLWNILSDAGQYDAALEQAQAAYDLMLCEGGGGAFRAVQASKPGWRFSEGCTRPVVAPGAAFLT